MSGVMPQRNESKETASTNIYAYDNMVSKKMERVSR